MGFRFWGRGLVSFLDDTSCSSILPGFTAVVNTFVSFDLIPFFQKSYLQILLHDC